MEGYSTIILVFAFTTFAISIALVLTKKARAIQKEQYTLLSDRLGLKLVESGSVMSGLIGGKLSIEGQIQGNRIELFTHTEKRGKSSKTYTNVAIVLNKVFPSTRFAPQNKVAHFFTKHLGLQDIEIGNPQIDDLYIFQSKDERLLLKFLTPDIQSLLIEMAPEIRGKIKIDSSLRYTESGSITSQEKREHWEKIIALCTTFAEKIDALA